MGRRWYVVPGHVLAEAGIDVFRAMRPLSLFTHYDVVNILVERRDLRAG